MKNKLTFYKNKNIISYSRKTKIWEFLTIKSIFKITKWDMVTDIRINTFQDMSQLAENMVYGYCKKHVLIEYDP